MSDLAAVDREFRKSMVVRKNKSLDDPGRSMDFSPYRYRPFAYVFTASSNRARR